MRGKLRLRKCAFNISLPELGRSGTGLLGEAPGGVWHVFSSAGIDVEPKKKVDWGFLKDPDCHGHGLVSPFSTVGGVSLEQVLSSR